MDDTWPNPAAILDDLPDDLRARIKAELVPGERLLWAARAVSRTWESGLNFLGMLVFAAGFIALCAVCIGSFFGPFAARLRGVEGLLFVVGVASGFIAFCLVATIFGTLGTLSWRRIRHRHVAANFYALTDRRAILWRPVLDTEAVTVHSHHRRESGRVHRVEYPDGSGDVTVSTPSKKAEGDWNTYSLAGVPDVRRVEALVRATLIGQNPETLA